MRAAIGPRQVYLREARHLAIIPVFGSPLKICIVSDSHDHRGLLSRALEEAKNLGAEAVLHCGDVVAPSALHVVRRWGLPMHVIHGNNVGDVYHMTKLAADPVNLVQFHGQDAQLSLFGRRIFDSPLSTLRARHGGNGRLGPSMPWT